MLKCFCGVDGDKFDRHGESTDCTVACAGDDREICGGRFAISVYYGDSRRDAASDTPTYLGCYEDSKMDRVMVDRVIVDAQSMTNAVRTYGQTGGKGGGPMLMFSRLRFDAFRHPWT